MNSAGDWGSNRQEERLDQLFAAYRDAVPAPEASPNFMPRLWHRIDSRRSFVDRLRWQASAFAAGAAMALLILGFLAVQPFNGRASADSTYVENLASQTEEAPEYAEVIFRGGDTEASFQ